MNRAKLLARLRKECAYEGDGSLDDVRAFISDNNIELQDASGKTLNLDKVYSAKTVFVEATAGEDVQVSAGGAASGKMDDDDEDDGEKEYDEDDEDKGSKTLAQRRAARAKASGGTSDRRAVGAMASAHTNRNARKAAHKAYDHRVAMAKNGHQFPAQKSPVFPDGETAEAFGAAVRSEWFRVHGDQPNPEDVAIVKSYLGSKTQVENVNSAGGALVFPEFSPYLVSLFEEYGNARRLFNVMPMSAETLTFSREASRPTVSAIGEAGSVTESESTFGNIMLVAKKAGGLTRFSNELLADSSITMADAVARAWAWAFTKYEDDCAWLGNGTSTYNGIIGINQMLTTTGTAGTIAGDASTASSWANFTESPFLKAQGTLPNYVRNPVWVCHKNFYFEAWGNIALNAGGAYAAEYEAGLAQQSPRILGMPVLFHQSMAKNAADTSANEFVITLGDYAMGAAFGDRQSVQIATSEQRYFDTDEFALRAIERFDIKVHDVGDSSNAGPIVGITDE